MSDAGDSIVDEDTGTIEMPPNEAGEIIIQAQRFRSQEQNRDDARNRLAALVRSVLEPPKPRVATKPTRSSQRKRLESKRLHGTLKQDRSKRHLSDD